LVSLPVASNTMDGTGSGDFVSTLSGLTKGTKYFERAYATNANGTGYGNMLTFSSCYPVQMISDMDGISYPIVTIGSQVWMAKNLATTKLNDQTAIPLVTDNYSWSVLTTPGYCWSSNLPAMFGDTYGALYNWYSVNTGKLCPVGWHIPNEAEWNTLVTFLGGMNVAGGKLKDAGTAHWNASNSSASNSSGFSGLQGGSRFDYGPFFNTGQYGHF
jgi:uncharacterized protein (TIGR02145 family)